MKAGEYSEDQLIAVLKEGKAGAKRADLYRNGISALSQVRTAICLLLSLRDSHLMPDYPPSDTSLFHTGK